MEKQLVLKRGKEMAVRRFHPWVFSGAIASLKGAVEDGDLVAVTTQAGEILGWAHYQQGKITARILSFGLQRPGADFWNQRLRAAWGLRSRLGLTKNPDTTAFRLVHGEGDGLPGLIIDLYDRVAVIQCHSVGMYRRRQEICEALLQLPDLALQAVYDKSRPYLSGESSAEAEGVYLYGHGEPSWIRENGHEFLVDWEQGQKTGFFLDQRNSRHLVSKFARGTTMVNLYSYSGGFSIYGLKAGAERVISVDASERALQWADANAAKLQASDRHSSVCQDAFQFLKTSGHSPDLMVVDPPAFAKSPHKRHQAVQAYKRLNTQALKALRSGGTLFTFSCSEVVSSQLFQDTIVAAALEAGRKARILYKLGQGPDHPIHLFHPEGHYLKGLVLGVE